MNIHKVYLHFARFPPQQLMENFQHSSPQTLPSFSQSLLFSLQKLFCCIVVHPHTQITRILRLFSSSLSSWVTHYRKNNLCFICFRKAKRESRCRGHWNCVLIENLYFPRRTCENKLSRGEISIYFLLRLKRFCLMIRNALDGRCNIALSATQKKKLELNSS